MKWSVTGWTNVTCTTIQMPLVASVPVFQQGWNKTDKFLNKKNVPSSLL